MPVLEPPTDDLTRRVTSDELAPDSYELENLINPLGEEPLFAGEGRAPGLQQNPANAGTDAEKREKSFREEYRERRQAKKNGTELPTKETPRVKNEHAITPQDQQVISEIEELIKNKKYGRALAMIAGSPRVREIMRSKVGEIRNQMALDAAKNKIKMMATNAIRTAVMDILIATSPWWEIILIVLLCIIALVIGIAIMMNRPVDNPPGTVPLGITDGNEAGIYLSSSIMVPSMKVSNASGKLNARTKELHFEETAGGWSPEEPVDLRGDKWCIPNKGCLAPISWNLPSTTTEEDMEYYVAARFPYGYGFDFDFVGYKDGPPRQGWGSVKDYSGKKIIIFNPKNNKAIVGIAAEFGPKPRDGMCHEDGRTYKGNVRNKGDNACSEMRTLWNARDVVAGPKIEILAEDRRAYDISPPPGYTGRTIGGEPKMRDKLGVKDDQLVIYGYATDQSLKPGTILDIKPSDIISLNGGGKGGPAASKIIAAAQTYLTTKTFPDQGYSPCAKFVTTVLNEAGVMKDYERACVILNSLLSGAAAQGTLTKQFPTTGSVAKFDISKADDAGSPENTLLNGLVPGDVIIVTTADGFSSDNHTVIYAGLNDGKHTIIHTTGANNVIKRNGQIAQTLIESIRPRDGGPYDYWSAYSFRSWNGKIVGGSAND